MEFEKKLYVPSPGVLDGAGYVHLPMRIADYANDPTYQPSTLQKLRNKVAKKSDAQPQWIVMNTDDYLRYWAKDSNGTFLSSVQEPPQGRVEWLRKQVRINEEWRHWNQVQMLATSKWIAFW